MIELNPDLSGNLFHLWLAEKDPEARRRLEAILLTKAREEVRRAVEILR